MENGKQPAFAQSENWQCDLEKHIQDPKKYGSPSFEGIGLTKREYFAGLAMQGLLTRVPKRHDSETDLGLQEMKRIVDESVIISDALLAELDKNNL